MMNRNIKPIISIVITMIVFMSMPLHHIHTDPNPSNIIISEFRLGSLLLSTPKSGTLFVEDYEDGFSEWNIDNNWSIVYEGMNQCRTGGKPCLEHINSRWQLD